MRRQCILAALCVTVSMSLAHAQSRPERKTGFVPLHEKIQRQTTRPASTATVTGAQPASARELELIGALESPEIQLTALADSLPPQQSPRVTNDTAVACDLEYPSATACTGPMSWWRAEYVYWLADGADAPALATASPAGTAQDIAGVLGRVGTSTLFGGGELNDTDRSGGRYTVGWWLDSCRTSGFELSYLSLEDDTESFNASGGELPILARPFFNTQLAEQDSRLIAFAGLVDGTLSIAARNEFQSFEVNYLRPTMQAYNVTTDVLIGYRYAELEDSVRVDESTLSLSGPTLGTRFNLSDQFATRNKFHGGQLGLRYRGPTNHDWALDVLGKLALGSTNSRISVAGQTTTTTATGDTSTAEGGLLAQTTNIGIHKGDRFGTMFELGASLRRNFTCGLGVTVGYTFLYWGEVARAAEQIDTSINPTQIPPGQLAGPARPIVPFERSDFWAQGLNVGLEYQF